MSIPASSQPGRSGVAAYLATLDTMTDLAAPRTAEVAARPTRRCVLDIVIPVYNEERDLPGSVRRLHRYLVAEVPYPSRITIADNASTDNTLAVARGARRGAVRRRGHPPRREGPRRGAVHRLDGLGGRRRRLHGRRSVDRPVGVDAACGAADFGPLRRRDRFPVGGVVAGGARAETRIRLSQLQLDPAWRARCPLLRCAVRLQGGARRRGAPTAAACRRHRLVLRHRAVGDRRTRRDCASTRCRSTGSTTRTRASTSCAPRSTTSRAAGGWAVRWRVARCRCASCSAASAASRWCQGVPRGMVGQMVRFGIVGVASTVAFALLYLLLTPCDGRPGREPDAHSC